MTFLLISEHGCHLLNGYLRPEQTRSQGCAEQLDHGAPPKLHQSTRVHPARDAAAVVLGNEQPDAPSNRLIAVGLKDCGGIAELTSPALELQIDAKSCPALIAGTPL